MNKKTNSEYISRDEVNEMIENALRRHNRRSTIISSVLGWILIGGYSFGLFQAVQNVQQLLRSLINPINAKLKQVKFFL